MAVTFSSLSLIRQESLLKRNTLKMISEIDRACPVRLAESGVGLGLDLGMEKYQDSLLPAREQLLPKITSSQFRPLKSPSHRVKSNQIPDVI